MSERLSLQHVFSEVLAFLSWEKGSPHTSWRLLRSPGRTIRSYLEGERDRLTNPLRYLIMACAIVTAVFVLFMPRADFSGGASLSGMDRDWDSEAPDLLPVVEETRERLMTLRDQAPTSFLAKNCEHALEALDTSLSLKVAEINLTWMNVFLLLALPVNTAITWLFFRHAQLNVAEHVAANAYILGLQNLASIVTVPAIRLELIGMATITAIYMLLSFGYQFVAWRQLFQLRGWKRTILGLVGVILSVIGFIFLQGIATVLLLAYAS